MADHDKLDRNVMRPFDSYVHGQITRRNLRGNERSNFQEAILASSLGDEALNPVRQEQSIMRRPTFFFCFSVLLLASSQSLASEESKTVIGPENIYLYDGANALMAQNGEDGVRLTLLGLAAAKNAREEKIAHSNLCAGYLMIGKPDTALGHCDWVIEKDQGHWRTYNNRALVYMRLERYAEAEEDIRKGQALRPSSRKLKIVKGMYLDETQPVTPRIEVDERRKVIEDAEYEHTDDGAN